MSRPVATTRLPFVSDPATCSANSRQQLVEFYLFMTNLGIASQAIDIVYQLIEHRWQVYPGEAILVAIILAIVPYLLVRGPINRIFRRRSRDAVKERLVG